MSASPPTRPRPSIILHLVFAAAHAVDSPCHHLFNPILVTNNNPAIRRGVEAFFDIWHLHISNRQRFARFLSFLNFRRVGEGREEGGPFCAYQIDCYQIKSRIEAQREAYSLLNVIFSCAINIITWTNCILPSV